MSQRFAVVYEAAADLQIATELADRALIDAIGWLDEHHLVTQREWISARPDSRAFSRTSIKQLAREIGIKAHGHFDGRPGEPDAAAARRAILCIKQAIPNLQAIVLIRDQDDQPERRTGLEQAQDQNHGGTVIVVGLAIVEREAWAISGFEPIDDVEQELLNGERQKLGIDPRLHSHELVACKDDSAIRSPKRVLKSLCRDDRDRERICWTDLPLDQLRQRGVENGLATYLNEVRDHLAPLIGYVAKL